MIVLMALIMLAAVSAFYLAHRRGSPFDRGSAQTLAFLAATFGFGLAASLAMAVVGAVDYYSAAWVTWWIVAAVIAALSGVSLVIGAVRWDDRTAWALRLAGFVGLLVATLGSMASFVLPLLAPLALLAVPSLFAEKRAPEQRALRAGASSPRV